VLGSRSGGAPPQGSAVRTALVSRALVPRWFCVWRSPQSQDHAAVWQAAAGPLIALALAGPVLFVVLLAVTGR
jgi:hypothetical protein